MTNILDMITGESASDAAGKATRQQVNKLSQAIRELRGQHQTNLGYLDPYMQAGQAGLPLLQQGATVGGYSDLLAEIMGTGMFDELVDERMRGAQGMLAAGGLTRSGAALEEGARIPVDIATQLAGILTGNAGNLANMGQATAAGAANLGANFGINNAALLQQIGAARAAGTLGQEQAETQGLGNILSLGTGAFNAFAGGPPGGAPIGGTPISGGVPIGGSYDPRRMPWMNSD